MTAWVWWLVLSGALGVLELLTLDLTLLMLAGGAAVGAAIAWVGGPIWLQIIGAAITSVALLTLVRPVALRQRRVPAAIRTGTEALIGSTARTLQPVTAHSGLIKLAGETWTARSYDGNDIAADHNVNVIQINGATALVLPE